MIDYYNNETRLTEILRAVVNSSTIDLGPARTREEIFVSRAFGLTMWPAIPPRTTMEMWLAFIAGDTAEPAAGTYTVRTCAESCIITYARRVRGASAVVPIFAPHTHYERALAKLAGIVPLDWGVLGREWEHLLRQLAAANMPRSAVAVIGGEHAGNGPGGVITPFQDLRGYGRPWAGGTGKNLLENTGQSKTDHGITWTVNGDGSISAKGTSTSNSTFVVNRFNFNGAAYILTGCPEGGATSTRWQIQLLETLNGGAVAADTGSGVTITRAGNLYIRCVVRSGNTVDFTFQPMIRRATVTDDTFEPFANVCPIYPGLTLVRDSGIGLVVWGGSLDAASGQLTVTDAEIASYAGETLPGVWISDRDAYAAGAAPTTGAQVVYKLADPVTYQLTRAEVQRALNGADYLGAGVWKLNDGVTIIRAQIRTESLVNHYDLAASNDDWTFEISVDGMTASGGSGILSVAAGDHDVVIIATPSADAGVCVIQPTLYYTAVSGLLGMRRDLEEPVEPWPDELEPETAKRRKAK